MKNLISTVLFTLLITSSTIAQDTILYIYGQITDEITGTPVGNHPLSIHVNGGGMTYSYEFFTDNNGYYVSDTIYAPSQGTFIAETYDCNFELHQHEETFNPGNYTFNIDFAICTDSIPPGGCTNWFTVETNDSLTYTFTAYSEPIANAYFWSFGDGNTGEGQQVTYSYAPNIEYAIVTLHTFTFDPITADSCLAISTQELWLGGTGQECNAYFEYQIDSMPMGSYLVNFIDYSTGDISNWYWDFGDGNTSTQQNPTYEYSEEGNYFVCLTVSSDSTNYCWDVYCQEIQIGNGSTGCTANFTYNIDSVPGAIPIVVFTDLSTGNIQNWFWDFGDNNYSNEQNPIHSYEEEGYYVVCLTVSSDSSINCNDIYCLDVYVGNGGGSMDCENFFTYENLGDNTFTFYGESTPDPADYYFWDFGDGSYAEGQQVTYSFGPNAMDSILVCLTTFTMNPAGDSCFALSCQTITLGSQNYHNLYGMIYIDDSATAGYAMVGLFGIEGDEVFIQDFVITENGSGSYYFENVPEGDYYIWASLLPLSEYYMEYFPTYFGDELFWFDATLISLGTPTNPYGIHLIPVGDMGTGPGNIAGNIIYEGYKSYNDEAVVLLMDENENPLGYLPTNELGEFSFVGLPYGPYKLQVELPGVTSDVATLQIDENNQSVNIDFIVNGTTAILSIASNNENLSFVSEIYPNPVTHNATLQLETLENVQLDINIYNQLGQEVADGKIIITPGKQSLKLPIENLQNGFYTLKIHNNSQQPITRKFIIAH